MSKNGEQKTPARHSFSGGGDNEKRMIIIGEREAVWIFQGLGIRVSFVQSVNEAKSNLEEAIGEKYQFICLTETYAEELIPRVNELASDTGICVTIIPGIKEKKNLGFARLRKFSERGIGVDLVSAKS
jgi:vacuolar-type H+-ATPase subunit F/Vma7